VSTQCSIFNFYYAIDIIIAFIFYLYLFIINSYWRRHCYRNVVYAWH